MINTSSSLTCSTSSSNLNSTLGGGLLSSSLNDIKGDRGGGDSSSVVSSSSSSSKKGKKGRKPNSEKGSSGSNEGKVEPLRISSESLNASDAPSTTSEQQKTEKAESNETKVDTNAIKLSMNHSNVGASSSNSKTNESSSSPTQNSKDLSNNSAIHGNSQNSTSTHNNQLKDEAAKRSSPSLATVGISTKPSSELTSESPSNGNTISSTNSKPPSVIVKFGKQDGTYYSKKDPISSQAMPNSSASAITTSSISQPSNGSANSSATNDNSGNKDLNSKPPNLSSQFYNHKDTRHGKKHSQHSSKGSQKDHSTTEPSALISNNGLDNNLSKLNGPTATNGPVDCATANKSEKDTGSKFTPTNNKHALEDSSDPYQKGFTNANFTESTVTPTSSVGETLFSKDTVPRSQSHHVSGSNYQDKESYQSRKHNSHSIDRQNYPQSSTGASLYTSDKYVHGNSVTTSIVKSEPLDYGKNQDALSPSKSRSINSAASHHLDKNVLPDKPNVDLKITKYGVHDTSNGKSSQGYSSYNKHSYDASSMRGERSTSSSVTVSKSTHHVSEPKKDSPAKILPISASSTSPEKSGLGSGGSNASFGRPLKVEISSGNASRSSSLEVSPVKRTEDATRKDLSPSKLSKEYGYVMILKLNGKQTVYIKINTLSL